MSGMNNPLHGSSWEPLEPVFQLLLPVLFGERQAESEEEKTAIKQIRLALVTAASRIFRSPRMRGNDCEPQVAVQNWFTAVRAAKHSYKPDKPFHKYAYRVLSNICRDLGRRARVRRTVRISIGEVSSSATPLELAIRREQVQRVRQALRTLKLNGEMSREQCAAIELKYYRGLSSKEAGERCGVDAAKIDQWAYQARKLLLKQLCEQRRKAS
jgi:RNA polymerase sigma factor (sigma-70 family)